MAQVLLFDSSMAASHRITTALSRSGVCALAFGLLLLAVGCGEPEAEDTRDSLEQPPAAARSLPTQPKPGFVRVRLVHSGAFEVAEPRPPAPLGVGRLEPELNNALLDWQSKPQELQPTNPVIHPAQGSVDQRLRIDTCYQLCKNTTSKPNARHAYCEGDFDPAGEEVGMNALCFFLVRPEVAEVTPLGFTTQAALHSPAYRVPSSWLHKNPRGTIAAGSRTLCDPSLDSSAERGGPISRLVQKKEGANPYKCGADDCYRVWVESMVQSPAGADTRHELWSSRPLVVRVGSPKTPDADIIGIEPEAEDPVSSPHSWIGPPGSGWFTPTVTGDGKLFILQQDRDAKFAFNELGDCRASGWKPEVGEHDLLPLTRLRS